MAISVGQFVLYYPDVAAVATGRPWPAWVLSVESGGTSGTVRTLHPDVDLDATYGPHDVLEFPNYPTPVSFTGIPTASAAFDPATLSRNWLAAKVDTSGGPGNLVIGAGSSAIVPYLIEDSSSEFTQDGIGIFRSSPIVYGLFGVGGAISWAADNVNADITADVIVGRDIGLPGEDSSVVMSFTVGASPTGNPRGIPTLASVRLGAAPPDIGPNQIAIRLRHDQGLTVTVTIHHAIVLVNQFTALP